MSQSWSIKLLEIHSDPKLIKRVRLGCRCGHRWVEDVPGELLDSQLRCRFTCNNCSTQYDLQNRQFTRVQPADSTTTSLKEDATFNDNDSEQLKQFAANAAKPSVNKFKYDA